MNTENTETTANSHLHIFVKYNKMPTQVFFGIRENILGAFMEETYLFGVVLDSSWGTAAETWRNEYQIYEVRDSFRYLNITVRKSNAKRKIERVVAAFSRLYAQAIQETEEFSFSWDGVVFQPATKD